jgi:hypothetical protein
MYRREAAQCDITGECKELGALGARAEAQATLPVAMHAIARRDYSTRTRGAVMLAM